MHPGGFKQFLRKLISQLNRQKHYFTRKTGDQRQQLLHGA
jgi:hypothetical protein